LRSIFVVRSFPTLNSFADAQPEPSAPNVPAPTKIAYGAATISSSLVEAFTSHSAAKAQSRAFLRFRLIVGVVVPSRINLGCVNCRPIVREKRIHLGVAFRNVCIGQSKMAICQSGIIGKNGLFDRPDDEFDRDPEAVATGNDELPLVF
jgi:hypothetical protein